jgi:hypothetical protein
MGKIKLSNFFLWLDVVAGAGCMVYAWEQYGTYIAFWQ